MRSFFTIISCLLFLLSHSQPPILNWQKSYGGSQLDVGYSAYQTKDGGSIVANATRSSDGDVTSYKASSLNTWITKLDADGAIVWQKCFFRGTPASIIQTLDGGYMVAGSNDSGVVRNHGDLDVWLIKLDSLGKLQWQTLLGGTATDYANTIRQTEDSGYIVACTTGSTDGDVTGNHTKGLSDGGALDWWIVKTDKKGRIQWEECLGGSAADFDPHAEETSDKGYIITGTTASNDGNVSGIHSLDYDAWVVKLNAAGTLQWQRCYGGTYGEEGKSIKQLPDSSYVMLASSRSDNGDVSQNRGNSDYWIVKLKANGTIGWEKNYGGTDDDIPTDLQVAGNGFVAAGYTASGNGDITGFHGVYDYWLVKTDTLGNLLWQKALGGENDDEAYALNCSKSGTYLVSGFSNSFTGDVTGNHGDIDSWIIYLQDETALPVSLLSFSAQRQGSTVQLQWQATANSAISYFSIERSANALSFSSIGSRREAQNNGTNDYSFADLSPLPGIIYYRLKEVRKDGTIRYSNIVSVAAATSVALFTVSPNPAINFISVQSSVSAEQVQVIVRTLNGKIVYTSKQNLLADEKIQVPVSQLAGQILLVTIVSGNHKERVRVLIK